MKNLLPDIRNYLRACNQRLLRGLVKRSMCPPEGRGLDVSDPMGSFALGNRSDAARLVVHDLGFWRKFALKRGRGLADSYINGAFDSDDLAGLCRVVVRNEGHLWGLACVLEGSRNALFNIGRTREPCTRRHKVP